ncbi:hypothetical protein AB0C07_26345 [Actinoplanes missouriensis]|uniref:hypothetical protein n=1 Tax=Actinoplanes missouriensis TaxID=1866 RepID=UPI0033D1CBB2
MTAYTDEYMSPQRLSQVVTERLASESAPIAACCFQVSGSRDRYADDLRRHLAGTPAVVLVVRETLFENLNAFQADFAGLVEKHRSKFEAIFDGRAEYPATVAVVLLFRHVPAVPQGASPAVMPAWFPRIGGMEIQVSLHNLTWTGSAAVDCEESGVAELSATLFTLDKALLDRLAAVHSTDPGDLAGLWQRIRSDDRYDFGEFVTRSRQFRGKVQNRQAFRPNAADGLTTVARLWKAVQRTKLEGMPDGIGADLSRALGLPVPLDLEWYQPFTSVLSRTAGRSPAAEVAFACSVLRTVGTTSQFITVAAHADDYAAYPVVLLRSVSLDLLAGLRSAVAVLDEISH